MLSENERRRIRARQHAAGDAGGGSTDGGTDDEDGGVSRASTPDIREWTVGRNNRQFWAGAPTPPMSPTALGVGRSEAAAEAEAEAEEAEAEEAAARLARTPAMPPHPQMGCADSFDGFELVLDSPSDGLPGPDLGGHPARGDDLGGDSLCEVELQRQRELPAAEEAHGDDARLDPRLGSPQRAATISRPAPPPTPIARAADGGASEPEPHSNPYCRPNRHPSLAQASR